MKKYFFISLQIMIFVINSSILSLTIENKTNNEIILMFKYKNKKQFKIYKIAKKTIFNKSRLNFKFDNLEKIFIYKKFPNNLNINTKIKPLTDSNNNKYHNVIIKKTLPTPQITLIDSNLLNISYGIIPVGNKLTYVRIQKNK